MEYHKTRISVLIPAFKETYLKEALESVLNQTYNLWELIVVDDNSPYRIESIIDCFDDPRISYYRNDVGFGALHVVGNWNKCLSYASGDFVLCMGDDDKLAPECLANYVRLISKYPNLDVYHTRLEMIDETSTVCYIKDVDDRPEFEDAYTFMTERFKGRSQFIGDYLFRTETLRNRGGFIDFPCAWFSDEITVVMMIGGKGIANTQETGFFYRINRYSISSNSTNTKSKLEAIYKAKAWYDMYLNKIQISSSKIETLKKLLKKYMSHSEFVTISYDISFRLISGIAYWKQTYSIGYVLMCLAYGFRLKVGRIIKSFFKGGKL